MNRLEQHHKKLFEAQETAVRLEADGELTEEQIQKRCTELKNQIIDAENINKRFRNPALHRIWNSPPRFKKL